MNRMSSLLLPALLACLSTVPALAADTAAPAPPAVPVPAVVQPAVPVPVPVAQPAAIPAAARFGQIDVNRVASESETGKTGQGRLVELKKKLQAQIEVKRKQLEKQKAALDEKLKTADPKKREALTRDFQKKYEEFQKFAQNAEGELKARSEEFSEVLYKAIEQASAEIGKAKDLALVVIKRELLFRNSNVDELDVTDDVIKRIDKK